MTTTQQIQKYSRSGFPAIAICTSDEDRAINSIIGAVNFNKPGMFVLKIAAAGGIFNWNHAVRSPQRPSFVSMDAAGTYKKAFDQIAGLEEDSILIVLDFQHVIRTPVSYRQFRDALTAVKAKGTMIVLVAPSWQMPPELEHDVPVIHDALPTREELDGALQVCINATEATIDDATKSEILDAASGLTVGEAEGAMSLAFDGKTIRAEVVVNEKMKLVRQSGHLEVSAPASIADLGGLGALREYFENEIAKPHRNALLEVRALLLVGVPGGGKSLSAKVAGAILRRPVLRCDIAGLKGSKVGQSEQAIRDALKLAEAVAPCILWLDEIEKAVGGYASSAQTDSGVTLGMVGALLTWMQEHKSRVLTIATCNNYNALPAELTRAGRFDERFFVGLPTNSERVDIARVHLSRFDSYTEDLAEVIKTLSEGWTGSEIEQLVKSAARRTECAITAESLRESARFIKPLSKVRAAEIGELIKWGTENLRSANTPEVMEVGAGRKIKR